MDTSSTPVLVRSEGVLNRQGRLHPDSGEKFALRAQICSLGLLLAMLAGCGKPVGPVLPDAEQSQQTDSANSAVSTTGTIDLTQLPKQAETVSSSETWHANYMQGKKIGYRHTHVRELKLDQRRFVLTNILEKQAMLRFGEKFTMEIRATQLEDDQGKVLQFSYQLPAGLGPGPMQGVVEGDKVNLRPLSSRQAVAKQIPWPANTVGFDGVEQSLLSAPLPAGETRTLEMLQIPPLDLVSKVVLKALEPEETALLTGEVRLLKIEQQLTMPGGGQMLIHLWTDEKGQVLKYSIPQLQQETFLTTKTQALDESDGSGLDLGNDLLVRLKKPLEDPHRADQRAYQVQWKGPDVGRKLLDLFSDGLSQEVGTLQNVMVFLHVHAIRPDQPAKLKQKQPEPTDADREPSPLVQSDDAEIAKLAASATQAATEDWDKAIALEKFVHEYLTEKNYSQAFSSAAEVAKSREGDCTEHAVFLAALCRANKIPARVAFGLVYVPSEQAFAFHMWNEVWIKDRWIPLDSTLALGGIGAGHLKMGTSPLADLTALIDLLPVMQAMGKIEISALPPNWSEHLEKAEVKP